VRPAQPPPPTPTIPTLYLEYAGNRVPAGETFYRWRSSAYNGSGGGASAPVAALIVPHGANVNIVVNYPTPPAVLWVAELDGNGIPRATAALTPGASATPYEPVTSGRYRLQVTAEWTYESYVTGIFDLDVQP
jgi:hypothetical protein